MIDSKNIQRLKFSTFISMYSDALASNPGQFTAEPTDHTGPGEFGISVLQDGVRIAIVNPDNGETIEDLRALFLNFNRMGTTSMFEEPVFRVNYLYTLPGEDFSPLGGCGVTEWIPIPTHALPELSHLESMAEVNCGQAEGHDGWHLGVIADVENRTFVAQWTGKIRRP